MTKAFVFAFKSWIASEPTPPAPPMTKTRLTLTGSARRVTEHRFPGRDCPDRQAGGGGEGERVGNGGDDPVIGRHALRPCAVTPHVARAEHAVADLETADGRTDADHFAGKLPAEQNAPAGVGAAGLA